MDDFHRCAEVSVGGWKCPCCGPAPKHRAKARRQARRRLKQQTDKEIREEVCS